MSDKMSDKNKAVRITFRVTREQSDRLAAVAKKRGQTPSEILRSALARLTRRAA